MSTKRETNEPGNDHSPLPGAMAPRRPRVLVVDDDPRQLELARVNLQAAGFDVELAHTATEALALVSRNFDCVLSDVVMEEGDGFTLCKAMREREELRSTPIVLTSADFQEKADRELALAVGANELVVKAPDCQPAIDALVRMLEQRESAKNEAILNESSSSSSETAALYTKRFSHQLVELRKKTDASERKYRTLFENIPDVVSITDLEGKMLFVSPNVLKLTGFTAEEMLNGEHGTRFERLHPEDEAIYRAQFAEMIRTTKSSMHVEVRWRRRDGQWIWLQLRGAMTTDERGEAIVQNLITDITDRKKLEEQMRQAQKLETIAHLTSGVAHDFNNLLAIIMMHADLLLSALPEGSLERGDAYAIKSGAERATKLTRQLLSFSRRQPANPKTVVLGDVLANVEPFLRPLLGSRISVNTVPPPSGLGKIYADQGQLEQVIMNVAVNARDAMLPGGGGKLTLSTSNVVITTASEDAKKAPPGAYVMMSISDTGTGMSEETKAKIFEPFFTTKGEGKGTGLGLSTSYGIVRSFGGYVEVETEEGKGTTFKFLFPRLDPSASSVTTQAPVSAATALASSSPADADQLTPRKILLIDDDDAMCALVTRVMRRRGHSLLVAKNQSEAESLTTENLEPIDLILSDVNVPGSSGPAIVREILSRRTDLEGVPILFMSGAAPPADQVMDNFHASFVEKPFSTAALVAMVEERFHQQPARAATKGSG